MGFGGNECTDFIRVKFIIHDSVENCSVVNSVKKTFAGTACAGIMQAGICFHFKELQSLLLNTSCG